MSEIIPLTKKYSYLKKGIINMVLFFLSIAGVTSIILHNVKVTGIETAGTLIIVTFCYFILFSVPSAIQA
jgi:hypothetical protein